MNPQAHALPPDVQHAAFERDLAINEVVRVNKAHDALLSECKRQRVMIEQLGDANDNLISDNSRLREQIAKLRDALQDMTYGIDCRKDSRFVTAPRWAYDNAKNTLADVGVFKARAALNLKD